MNREQLEKILKEKICITGSFWKIRDDIFIGDVKDFIFDIIIPEVLNSIIINKEWKLINIDAIVNIKQKAKELYNITL